MVSRMVSGVLAGPSIPDDLSREVYCILGVPIDAIELAGVLKCIEIASTSRAPFVISTPNLNFVVNSQVDSTFRESLLVSNLCPPDGMPIIWIARLVGVPIKNRVAGSDILEALKTSYPSNRRLKVVLFGGAEGIAAKASRAFNEESDSGLYCVGAIYPGYGTIEELSQDELIKTINSSHADFLVASLGAQKGQLWLLRNHDRLQIPIRAHLGAAVNFQAGVVKRAPLIMQRYGLEWLWRMKEEPLLWRRYWHDASVLLRLLLTRVLPLAIWMRVQQMKYAQEGCGLLLEQACDAETVTLRLRGVATAEYVEKAIECFRDAVTTQKRVIIDLSETRFIDPRLIGLLLMLRKCLHGQAVSLTFVGISPSLKRMFLFNGVEFLLSAS
jgi:N-acetylglucosaminyldiphosphoundecaprenol N-acetyl-beta-D-mannosaminyltransferase